MTETYEIDLGTNLTIAQVDGLLDRLLEINHDPADTILKASAIERADTSGLQCLYAFKRDIEEQGVAVTWQAPSENLTQAANLLGMSESLGL